MFYDDFSATVTMDTNLLMPQLSSQNRAALSIPTVRDNHLITTLHVSLEKILIGTG